MGVGIVVVWWHFLYLFGAVKFPLASHLIHICTLLRIIKRIDSLKSKILDKKITIIKMVQLGRLPSYMILSKEN